MSVDTVLNIDWRLFLSVCNDVVNGTGGGSVVKVSRRGITYLYDFVQVEYAINSDPTVGDSVKPGLKALSRYKLKESCHSLSVCI